MLVEEPDEGYISAILSTGKKSLGVEKRNEWAGRLTFARPFFFFFFLLFSFLLVGAQVQ